MLLFAGCTRIVAPDRVRFADDKLWIADHVGKSIMTVDRASGKIMQKKRFPAAVNDLLFDSKNRLWAVCDGQNGMLYELNPDNLKVLSGTPLGYGPSALVFNETTGTLWVAQRFGNELWEVNPVSKEILSRIGTGREPVGVLAVSEGRYLLVVNNLPAISSTSFPVATHIDVIDATDKKVIKRISLPNGATDARAIAGSPDGKYAYITHLVGRYQLPTHQVDRGWMSTNALSVIDLDDLSLETTVLLDSPQRGAANPSHLAVSPNGRRIIIALTGSHALCVIDRTALHDRLAAVKNREKVIPSVEKWEDIPDDAGFLYGIREFIPAGGKGPRSFASTPDGIVTANYFTGEITTINHQGQITRCFTLGAPVVSTKRGLGELYFHDATLCFQQWQSCASCHPNNARADGLNWDLVNDGVGNPKNTKSLLHAHRTPPAMITGIRHDAATAVRSGIKYILFADAPDEVAQAMDEYLKSLIPATSPYLVNGRLSEAAKRGKTKFNTFCASCHAGRYYTDMKQYRVDWTTPKDHVPMDVPTLVEVWRTAPYLYDGRSYTIREMLEVHGPEERLSATDLDDLAEYVLSL